MTARLQAETLAYRLLSSFRRSALGVMGVYLLLRVHGSLQTVAPAGHGARVLASVRFVGSELNTASEGHH